ncbi:MAG: hypothetical protein LBI17_03855 [Rickettsiales bacterium]|jgi:deoxyribose-phosphate aldolase|nr:hypothetical protein [Rickettsiales bacterium]
MPPFCISEGEFSRINLYGRSDVLDAVGLVGLCKAAADRGLGSLTVDDGQVESVWKWLEKSGVAIVGRIGMAGGLLPAKDLFRRVKAAYSAGAGMVEVAPPPDFYDVGERASEYLSVISEAKGSRPVKVCVESGFIGGVSALKRAAAMLAESGADYVKTASSLYARSSDVNHLNAVLEALKDTGAGADFLFDTASSGRFVVQDAFRLAGKICGPDFIDRFYVSCNSKLFY